MGSTFEVRFSPSSRLMELMMALPGMRFQRFFDHVGFGRNRRGSAPGRAVATRFSRIEADVALSRLRRRSRSTGRACASLRSPASWPAPECRRTFAAHRDCGSVRRGWWCSFLPRRSAVWARDRAGQRCRRWKPRRTALPRAGRLNAATRHRRRLSGARAWCRNIRRRCERRNRR